MATKKWYGVADLEKRLGPMTVGRCIKAWRENDEIALTDYAKKLGISRANLCDIEKGRKLVSPERAAKIARSMGLPEIAMVQLALEDQLRAAKLRYRVELSEAS